MAEIVLVTTIISSLFAIGFVNVAHSPSGSTKSSIVDICIGSNPTPGGGNPTFPCSRFGEGVSYVWGTTCGALSCAWVASKVVISFVYSLTFGGPVTLNPIRVNQFSLFCGGLTPTAALVPIINAPNSVTCSGFAITINAQEGAFSMTLLSPAISSVTSGINTLSMTDISANPIQIFAIRAIIEF